MMTTTEELYARTDLEGTGTQYQTVSGEYSIRRVSAGRIAVTLGDDPHILAYWSAASGLEPEDLEAVGHFWASVPEISLRCVRLHEHSDASQKFRVAGPEIDLRIEQGEVCARVGGELVAHWSITAGFDIPDTAHAVFLSNADGLMVRMLDYFCNEVQLTGEERTLDW